MFFDPRDPGHPRRKGLQYSLSVSVVFDPASYAQMSDGALLRIAMERAELTPEAGAAFGAELAKRGLGEEQVRSFAISYRAASKKDNDPALPRGFGDFLGNWRPFGTGRNPFGLVFYGKRDLKQMQHRQQYQATRWFTIFWIPLVPLGTYIVHRTTTTWLGLFDDVRVVRKVPLDWEQVFKTWAVSALAVAALYFVGPWWLGWWFKR